MPRSNAREKMIQTAALMMRERGVEATSFSEVLARSGAPRGSIYYHFPEGKAQLIEEATRWAGDFITVGERRALQRGPMPALSSLLGFWREVIRTSDFGAGCPIAAATIDSESYTGARTAAAAAFHEWEQLLAESLQAEGLSRKRAQSLATTIIASLEGAVILCRAQRSETPLDRVGSELRALLRAALENSPTKG